MRGAGRQEPCAFVAPSRHMMHCVNVSWHRDAHSAGSSNVRRHDVNADCYEFFLAPHVAQMPASSPPFVNKRLRYYVMTFILIRFCATLPQAAARGLMPAGFVASVDIPAFIAQYSERLKSSCAAG